jgi:hypothetical protein
LDASELKPGYEAVFTVTGYYDGPRQGIANYLGAPHFYDCVFDKAKDNYSELFRLMPIDPEISVSDGKLGDLVTLGISIPCRNRWG